MENRRGDFTTSRRGQTVLDTGKAAISHETGDFIQWYFPSAHVPIDLLEKSGDQTVDPVNGRRPSYVMIVAGPSIGLDIRTFSDLLDYEDGRLA